MVVAYTLEDGRLEAHLCEHSDWKLFNVIASTITERFGGRWVTHADRLDQRYWDLEIDDVVLTLHLEHYLGIFLFPASNPGDLEAANSQVETISNYLDGIWEDA
jgi:hypothetical protein